MVQYNVTVNVEGSILEDWLQYMRKDHIPEVLATGLFKECKMCRLVGDHEDEGHTFSFQYILASIEHYETYQASHAPGLQADVKKRFEGKFVAFRTLMEVVEIF